MTNPDWYPDPLGRFEVRYHDGAQWTEHVATGGAASADPMPAAQPPTFEQGPSQQGGFQPPDQQQTVAFQGPTGPPGPGSLPLQNDGPPPTLGSFPTEGLYQPPGGSGGGGGKVVGILAGVAVLALLLVGSAIFLLNRSDDGDVVAAGSDGSTVVEDDDGTTTTAADSTTTTIATTTESTTTTTATTLPTVDDDAPPAADPSVAIPEYGTDPVLDELANDCQSGDFSACDELFLVSDLDSGYEDYGDSCGERNPPAGFCFNIYSN